MERAADPVDSSPSFRGTASTMIAQSGVRNPWNAAKKTSAIPASGQYPSAKGAAARASAMIGEVRRRKSERRPNRRASRSGSLSLSAPIQYGASSANIPSPPIAKPIQTVEGAYSARRTGSSATMIVCPAVEPSVPAVIQ